MAGKTWQVSLMDVSFCSKKKKKEALSRTILIYLKLSYYMNYQLQQGNCLML